MSEHRFIATCPKGLGSLLCEELNQLGATKTTETVAGVVFEGGLSVAYRACIWSRFANRILLVLSEFAADCERSLYDGVAHLPWWEHMSPNSTLVVDFSGKAQSIRNTQFGAQRVKDAICDAFLARGSIRPSVDLKNPDLRFNCRMHRGKVTLALDLSGRSLHMRGYRLDGGKAPLKENLAAAVLTRADWPNLAEQGYCLVDPMCGSGTLLIEAAMIALKRAPNLDRETFGFGHWLKHNETQWQAVRADAAAQALETPPHDLELRGYDGDIRAIRRAEENIRRLGFEKFIRVLPKSLNELTRPTHRDMSKGLLVSNPPWGERLGDGRSVHFLYRQLGELMDREFRGWQAAVLTSDLSLGRAIGLRSHKQYKLNNGALDVHLLRFDLSEDNLLAPDQTVAIKRPEGSVYKSRAERDIPVLSDGAQMFANRLKKNLKRLQSWVKKTGVTCYRVYDADMPEYAVAVDWYDGNIHVAEYAAPKGIDEAAAQKRFDEAQQGVISVFDLDSVDEIATKQRRRQTGKTQYEKVAQRGERRVVTEGKVKALVNLYDYLDTGLFLDHRPLRLRIGEEAKGAHFLNLFCYTGVASLHAALGGAVTTTSVDLSNTYLGWFKDNLALNGLSDRQHRAERSDVMTWLANCDRCYDLVLLDPPSFSNSKSTEATFDVQRDHVALIDAVMRVLAPKGRLYFSNNRKRFQLDSGVMDRFKVTDITRQTIDMDFQRHSDIHQCWMIEHA